MNRRSFAFALTAVGAVTFVSTTPGPTAGAVMSELVPSASVTAVAPAELAAGGFVVARRSNAVGSVFAPAATTRPAQPAVPSRDSVLPIASSVAPSREPTNGSTGTRSMTHLIFSFVNSANPAASVAALPQTVGGVSWLVPWSNVEPNAPVSGVHTYDWSRIDADLAAAAASGRPSMVRVIAGQLSPGWVQPTVTFTMQQPAQTVTMPVPWSSNFLTNWTAFIGAYGARYAHDPRIWAIQMAGAGRQGEMSLGDWAGWTSTAAPPAGMGSDPATDAKLISAWDTIIDSYRAAFPNKASALDLGDPLNDGVIQTAVMSHAKTYGAMVYFQQNGLHANLNGAYPGLLTTASATTTVGWQEMSGGNTATALAGSFTVAISTNATYVEVYQDDCVNPANAAALSMFASR